jgi:hypothetical protein
MFKIMQSQARLSLHLPSLPFLSTPSPPPSMSFSQYFKDLDKESFFKLHNERLTNKEYQRITDQWKKPLEKKKLKRESKLANPI